MRVLDLFVNALSTTEVDFTCTDQIQNSDYENYVYINIIGPIRVIRLIRLGLWEC